MRAFAAAAAALLLGACAHPLEIRNLDQYSSLARGDPLERQTSIGLIASAPDADTQKLVDAVGNALGKYSAKVVAARTPQAAFGAEVLARVSATPHYAGAGSNWLVNFPGLLVGAPSWNGYAYTVGYDFQILLTRAWDNAKLDAWTLPVSLDVRHSSGMLLSPEYNPEVTEPTVRQSGEVVADYVARDIVRRLNSEGRLWKLEPPPDWVPPAPPPVAAAPAPVPAPIAPPVVAPPAPAAAPAPPPVKPAPKAAPTPPPVLAAGGSATLRAGGIVRNRPLAGAEALTLDDGALRLVSSTRNGGGVWWYVSAGPKQSGWVLARDLEPAAAKPPAAAAAAPQAPAAPVAAPVPAPAPPPSAPTAPARPMAWTNGAAAKLRAGAQARVRMAPDAEVARGIDPAGTVTLKTRIVRNTGTWWYVTSPGGSGWVLEADLQPAP